MALLKSHISHKWDKVINIYEDIYKLISCGDVLGTFEKPTSLKMGQANKYTWRCLQTLISWDNVLKVALKLMFEYWNGSHFLTKAILHIHKVYRVLMEELHRTEVSLKTAIHRAQSIIKMLVDDTVQCISQSHRLHECIK